MSQETQLAPLSDIGLVGLAVMGENLVLNMESRGFQVSVFNRSTDKVSNFIADRAAGKRIRGTYSLAELVTSLAKPRRVMLMVKAGKPVDDFIEALIPLMEEGDIIIDGGNSFYEDSIRRTRRVEEAGLLFVGAGVSGGEEGALNGPSIMPGGSYAAWKHIEPIFMAIAARADDGKPCCTWIGSDGAGHFVKMVHNGIEYGDMQLISEAYQLLKEVGKLSADEMQAVFAKWNKGDLDSYLIEITTEILGYKDTDGEPLVEKILDAAGQKGTGKWTVGSALEEGIPLTLIGEAVFARSLSSQKEERTVASNILSGPDHSALAQPETAKLIADLERALFASKIVSYAQGYALMRASSEKFGWDLDYSAIAAIWRGGCIIRSVFLDSISEAFNDQPDLANLMLADYFRDCLHGAQPGWRSSIIRAIEHGIPVPAFSAAMSYYDGYRSDSLPANMIQAQRDYFGAHTYERVDKPRGEYFHTDWTGRGGKTASTTYVV
ncbi:MAG: decarboxylating NADP(+)-dependent phosphogluconate dehydrogenase [Ruminococcaceae bacterium]|nr:decarboxylating NADP(+)-dependent phosphogluconate dehydrogenase [Oscillospiraceae bacterium]